MFRWHPEDVAQLKHLWAEGFTCRQIAHRLDQSGQVSRNAIIGKAHRLGLPERAPRGRKEPTGIFARKKRLRRPKSKPAYKAPRVEFQPTVRDINSEAALARMAAETAPDTVSFADLEQHHCRWPVQGQFCGHRKVDGISYCAAHAKRAFLQVSAKRAAAIIEHAAGARAVVPTGDLEMTTPG